MGIKQYSQEQLKEMALVEIAHELFEDHKKPVPFQELLNE
ncbi:DNA-directed RNA polymerase subunit delta, partial [Bacillus sp. FSL K6-1005]